MKENKFLAYFSLVISFLALSVPLLLFGFAVWSDRDSQPEQHNEYTVEYTVDSQSGFTENKERNRREGILYTIDSTEKVTLTSDNGEICVKIPRWSGFSAELSDSWHERLRMYHTENHDSMTYELISTWRPEAAGKAITAELEHLCDYHDDWIPGDVYHMTVNGIEIYYQPCYVWIYDPCIDWHYMVWADLGCGQVLKTEIEQGSQSDEAWHRAYSYETVPQEVTEPLNIEGVIEALYANIEVCTPEGEVIPVTYREPMLEYEGEAYYDFTYGAVREYKDDEYRKTTVCAELIDSLYEAVQTGGIEELLEREAIEENELSIAEKMDYIKKEETGKLASYDLRYSRVREYSHITVPPTQCCLMKGAYTSEEVLVYSIYDFSDERFDYMWFSCEKDNDGNTKAQKGIYIYGTDMREHYFLSCQGKPYLCIVNRDKEDEIESVVLYDFATPDYIGTVIYIDASSVYLCSYVRNEDSFGTEMPWYLYSNKIDRGKVYFAMPEQWKITEYLGESDALQMEDTGSAVYAREQERTQNLVDNYLGQEINMNWNRDRNYVSYFQSASEYGYYYTSLKNLYEVYRQPETLAMEAPLSCAIMQVRGFDEDIVIIVDKNGKAAICVEGRFFRLEKSDEETEELRTWE